MILLQLVVFAPIALTVLDISTRGSASFGRVLLQPIRNPIIIGVVFSVTGIHLPHSIMEPFRLIGAAAVPVVVISFGMSLHGQRILQPGSVRRDVILASAIKLAVMPAIAWLVGTWFGLHGHELFVVVVLAALPSAQNVFNYAQRYERGEVIARDTVLITTILAVPVLVLVAALLSEKSFSKKHRSVVIITRCVDGEIHDHRHVVARRVTFAFVSVDVRARHQLVE